jgi:hypothetical protein
MQETLSEIERCVNVIKTIEEVANIQSPGKHLCGLVWDGKHIWHSDGLTDLIYCIDPITGNVIHQIECEDVRTDLAFDGKNLW